MRITKLERVALENMASDIRRSANKLTRNAWDQDKEGRERSMSHTQRRTRLPDNKRARCS